jgi:hypothetical protein
MRRHTILLFVLMLFAAVGASAQSTWQGNAVVGRPGEFPDEGFYAASNSFPRNQVIEVTNLETDTTTRLVVSKRVDEPGIFLVVSEDAARELGMERGEPARVAVRPSAASAGAAEPGAERALSPDPDVNPSAALTEAELYPEPIAQAEEEPVEEPAEQPEEPEPAEEPSEPAEEPAEPATEPPAPAVAAAPRSGVLGGATRTAQRLAEPRRAPEVGAAEPPAEPPPEPTPAPPPPAPSVGNEVEQALRVVRDRVSRTDRFPPPRESGVATSLAPPPRREEELGVEGRLARVTPPEAAVAEERPAAESFGRLAPPEEEVVADLPPAEAEEPSTVAEAEPEAGLPPAVRLEDELRADLPEAAVEEPEDDLEAPEKPVPEDAVITLEPAEARPPEKPAEPVEPEAPEVAEAPAEPAPTEPPPTEPAPEPEEPAARDLPLVDQLDPNRYYLQVGAYSSPGSARDAINRLGPAYPTEVLADGGDERTLYRVLVGPLNKDERGSVLYLVRSMGYRDAFIRSVDG